MKNKSIILNSVVVIVVVILLTWLGIIGLQFTKKEYYLGVCQANVVSYVQDHVEDKNPENISNVVRAELKRDNIYPCDNVNYTIQYVPKDKSVYVTINGKLEYVYKRK